MPGKMPFPVTEPHPLGAGQDICGAGEPWQPDGPGAQSTWRLGHPGCSGKAISDPLPVAWLQKNPWWKS